MNITEKLFELQDPAYADFQAKLTPGLEREAFIGVRVPALRSFAKKFRETPEAETFLSVLPHQYYDENLLHGLLIAEIRDYSECVKALDAFLPYVDNWAVCDTMSPRVFSRHKQELMCKIREWSASDQVYTCRFGIGMLMGHFLDSDFAPELLEIPAGIVSDEYYINMMIAWFFATALAKQWDATVPYIEQHRLPLWVHNKTIQKAVESYRITAEQKQYLKTFRRKASK